MSLHSDVRKHHQKHAEKYVRRARGGSIEGEADKASDATIVRKGVGEHEDQLHGGKHAKLRLKRGGHVKGEKPMERLDKRARGGRMHGKGQPKVAVVVHAGDGQQAKQDGIKEGMQMGARMAAQKLAGGMKPPGAPPPPAGPGGPGMPPGPPPQMGAGPRPMPNGPPPAGLKTGGKVQKMTASAAGGAGRLEKSGMGRELIPVAAHSRRRRL